MRGRREATPATKTAKALDVFPITPAKEVLGLLPASGRTRASVGNQVAKRSSDFVGTLGLTLEANALERSSGYWPLNAVWALNRFFPFEFVSSVGLRHYRFHRTCLRSMVC
jgi:hypothetical protein